MQFSHCIFIKNFLKFSPNNCVFRPNARKFNARFWNFLQNRRKYSIFCNFLQEFFCKFSKILRSPGGSAPGPPTLNPPWNFSCVRHCIVEMEMSRIATFQRTSWGFGKKSISANFLLESKLLRLAIFGVQRLEPLQKYNFCYFSKLSSSFFQEFSKIFHNLFNKAIIQQFVWKLRRCRMPATDPLCDEPRPRDHRELWLTPPPKWFAIVAD